MAGNTSYEAVRCSLGWDASVTERKTMDEAKKAVRYALQRTLGGN